MKDKFVVEFVKMISRKGETSVLNTIIGALIGIGVAVVTISTLLFLIKPGNAGQNSLNDLANEVREINKELPGSKSTTIFFQNEDSFFYPISEISRNKHFQRTSSKLFSNDLDFIFSHTKINPNCEDNNCLCVCDEFDSENTKRCVPGKLFCEKLEGVSFSPGTERLLTRVKSGGIASYDLALISGTNFVPIIGPILSPAVAAYVLETEEKAPAQQRVKVIKCRGGEEYCKNSKEGDVSIIFDWLDNKGVYDSIK